jgi:hypothetical protein
MLRKVAQRHQRQMADRRRNQRGDHNAQPDRHRDIAPMGQLDMVAKAAA